MRAMKGQGILKQTKNKTIYVHRYGYENTIQNVLNLFLIKLHYSKKTNYKNSEKYIKKETKIKWHLKLLK